MCEILVKASQAEHPDPAQDRMRYKRGMFVETREDGHAGWGSACCLPAFAILKLPGISAERVAKYIEFQFDGVEIYRRRRWFLRWNDLPLAAKNKLQDSGYLTIKVGLYGGDYDYTWAQIRGYIRDIVTGLDEGGDI